MNKISTAPLSGFMELSPSDQLEFDRIKDVIRAEHVKRGFLPIDTPLIYRSEVLLAKAGGETEKQIYRFDKGDNDLSLRFDLTVPLARYVVDKQSELNFPFKVSQIAKSYRGERAQFGRFREFYQCDADVIGRGSLDISYDAEVIALVDAIYSQLEFGDFTIRVNNRKLLSGFIDAIGASSKAGEILGIIDKAAKITPEEFESEIRGLGLSDDGAGRLREFIGLTGDNTAILNSLEELNIDNEVYRQGLSELRAVISLLADMGVTKTVRVDLMIVRGLDYYTGTVYETTINGREREVGSVASGGRYDDLASNYSSENFPGVGVSIGLTRLFAALKGAGLVGETKQTPVDVLVLPFSSAEFAYSYKLADQLRAEGKNVDVLTEDMKFGKKMAYADKTGVASVVVVGENEVKTGDTKIKNMKTGQESQLDTYSDS
ncbi:MAG: histidine--tRNA ligase [Candidatus Nomurabacteria bacterium]|jgi:histidyl-tRNA synthetase|nr:histidine--tRNA ligase [Candidatus Nomurabacteria bacterium]